MALYRESFIITISERGNTTAIKRNQWIRKLDAKGGKSDFSGGRVQRQRWKSD